MAISYVTGFEMGHLGEFYTGSGTRMSVETIAARTGSYGLRASGSGVGANIVLKSRSAGGTLRTSFSSLSFWLKFVSFPAISYGCILQIGSGAGSTPSATDFRFRVGTSGVQLGGVQAQTTYPQDGLWHHILIVGSGTSWSVLIDGSSSGSLTIIDTPPPGTGLFLGIGNSQVGTASSGTFEYYLDDLVVSDGSDTMPACSVKLLKPTADPGALNSWTNGGGGTTSIFEGVNNIPPIGAAAATNGIKIKNAGSGSNLDYTPTMQSYIAAGVPVGAAIYAAQALCNDGEEVATGTKDGGVWIASNPAQAAGGNTFDYGDDVGALGTFPTGWATHVGPVSTSPSVTLATAPTMTVRKTTSTTRVVDVDFMGIYAAYTLPPVQQSVSSPAPSAFPYSIVRT